MTPAPEPPAIPGYATSELLGRGGMGEVWRARRLATDTRVALKLLTQAPDDEALVRFEQESATLAVLSHPYIVKVLDRGRAGDTLFYAMDLVDGRSLREIHRGHPLAPTEALTLIGGVASALAHAHSMGVVHRDLKPENILVATDGTPRLVDFGIAAIGEGKGRLTRTGTYMGTPGYSAPEQERSARRVDLRSDLYSLGVVLYELLCGERPMGRFALPSQRVKDIDPRIDPIVARVLSQRPSDRFASAGELRAALLQLQRPRAAAAVPDLTPNGGTSGQPLELSQDSNGITVRVQAEVKPPALEMALEKLYAWTGAGSGLRIGYELQHPDALNDAVAVRLEVLHHDRRRALRRTGFAASIPLVRAMASVIVEAVPQVEGAVFASSAAMQHWLQAGRKPSRRPPGKRYRLPSLPVHTPALLWDAIRTRGYLVGPVWFVALMLRMTLAVLVLGVRDLEGIAGMTSLLNGAAHCGHEHWREFNLAFFGRGGRLFPLSEEQMLELMRRPDEEIQAVLEQALVGAGLLALARRVQRVHALRAGSPGRLRDWPLRAVMDLMDGVNRVCVGDRRPLKPPGRTRRAVAYARARLSGVPTEIDSRTVSER